MGLNCMSFFACGEPLQLDSETVRKYAIVFTGMFALGWPMALMHWPSVSRARREIDEMIEEQLERHRRIPPGDARHADYFDFILGGTQPDGAPLPRRTQVVYGQIPFKNMGIYAGRVINQVLYQMVTRPEVLARVQPEIDRAFSGELTLDAVAAMPATRATILETVRMRPIASAVQRTVGEPFDFGGYRFEVGDRVFPAISVTHYLDEHFPDPGRFDIDRFMPERREDKQPYVFNAYGVGHHSCVAREVFELFTIAVVGTILHRFRIAADYKLRSLVDVLPTPWPGHTMRVVERRVVTPRSTARATSGDSSSSASSAASPLTFRC
jgi:cytochrome P450